jgi:single-strand DNA-binding protein
MVCKVTVIGNLGKRPEVKTLDSGKKYARFSLAVNKYKNKEKTTMWVDVTCWDEKKVEVLEAYADKGTKLYVEGELEKRTYRKDGVEKLAVEVVISAFKGELQLLTRSDEAGSRQESDSGGDTTDDHIPF